MIIWGTRGKEKVQGEGSFYCPGCGGTSPYSHKVVKRWFTLYFIPVFPMETLGEYVQCGGCQGTYKPEILSFDPKVEEEKRADEFGQHLKRIMILSALQDGDIDRQERSEIQRVFSAITGKLLSDPDLAREIVQAREARVSAADYGQRIVESLNVSGKEKLLESAVVALRADGELTEDEMERLKKLAGALGVSPAHFRGIVQEVTEAHHP